jgi:nucleotide-binding universal stress UspA family protein
MYAGRPRGDTRAMPLGPIICAVDETTSDAVPRTAGELASALGTRLLLVHVVADPPLFNSATERERDRNRATRPGVAMLRGVGELLPSDLDWEETVELGEPVLRISELAEREAATLIVVGSRGRGPLASALLGSVSQELTREAPCLVAVAGEKTEEEP